MPSDVPLPELFEIEVDILPGTCAISSESVLVDF
jgi:hypothetical protein